MTQKSEQAVADLVQELAGKVVRELQARGIDAASPDAGPFTLKAIRETLSQELPPLELTSIKRTDPRIVAIDERVNDLVSFAELAVMLLDVILDHLPIPATGLAGLLKLK